PAGSVLGCADKARETKARRIRKAWGGGMRQAGYMAAAGVYALDHHILRLKGDHLRAKTLADVVKSLPFVKSMMPTDTNIIVFELASGISAETFISKIGEYQVKVLKFSPTQIRMVTHLDIDDEKISHAIEVLKKIRF
ncbi:MAG TPA: beta-eliminating lyase-related protein, partial [Cyclobacteriaceae bacterium]|nr:beta-eliminating lyase-related protein [Cyclobacteriaceae bacterium]